MSEKITKEVTINGETRTVEFYVWHEGKTLHSIGAQGAFQKRQGQKVWADNLVMWQQPDGSYRLSHQTTILNRAGYRLIGWASAVQNDRNASQHNSSR